RVAMLGLRAARGDELTELIGDGVQWGQLRLRRDDDSELTEDEGKVRTDRFVIAESQVLLHHVSETLLRMFLAHAGSPDCPWIELSALRVPGVFPEKLKTLKQMAWSPEREADAAFVFMGGIPDDPDDEWRTTRDASVRLLRLLAGRLLEDSDLYNSAK